MNHFRWRRSIGARCSVWRVVLCCLFVVGALAGGAGVVEADDKAPTVVTHYPIADAVQVALDTKIRVTWSEPMAANSSFEVTGPHGYVAGAFSYDPDSYTVTFTPEADLKPVSRYGVLVDHQVDSVGNVQQELVQWSFNTVSPTSVTLSEFEAKSGVQQSWWWAAWLWLMLLISVFSLAGYLRLWMRRKFTAKSQPQSKQSVT